MPPRQQLLEPARESTTQDGSILFLPRLRLALKQSDYFRVLVKIARQT